MARTMVITLAEQVYEIPVAPLKRARAWRKQVQATLGNLLDLIADNISLKLDSVDDLIALAKQIMPVLLDAPDTILDLILSYAPALMSQRDAIEEHGYDEELIDALITILKAVFPLDRLTSLLGLRKPATLTSLPAPSGDSVGTTLTT